MYKRKALHIFEICVLVNNNLYGKLLSSLQFLIKTDERFKVTSVPFFIPDFNLLGYLTILYLKCYIDSIYINIILKQNKIIILLTTSFEKSKTVSFASSITKNIVGSLSRIPVKLICCILYQNLIFVAYLKYFNGTAI